MTPFLVLIKRLTYETTIHSPERCPRCIDVREEICPLIRGGIIQPPIEWARRASREDPISKRENSVQDMFARMQTSLAYGDIALVRTNPKEYAGLDIVPVVVARSKAPIIWERRFSVDGMFENGDVMVWIHDLKYLGG